MLIETLRHKRVLSCSYNYLWDHIVKALIKQHLKTVKGSQDILCNILDSQGDLVPITAQDKKHLDQKKH